MARSMKAAITDGRGGLQLGEVPVPKIGDHDCLVKINACAFCNSTDAHIVNGTMPFDLPYPAVLGHETVGTVVEIGNAVRQFNVGDRVLRAYALYPDQSADGIGSAWGGFAEFGRVTDWDVMGNPPDALRYQQKIPPQLSDAQATLLIPQKEIWSSLNKLPDIINRHFVITGAGITGLLFGWFLKHRGAARVTVVARRRGPLQRVLEFEAADDVCLFDNLHDLPRDYDAMIETTGSATAAMRAIPCIREDGVVYAYAVYPADGDAAALEAFQAARQFVRIDPDEASAERIVHELALKELLHMDKLVTHSFPLDRIADAWNAVLSKEAMKVIVCP